MPDNLNPPFLVEFKENPGFLGRADDLERLHAALLNSGTAHYPDGIYWLNAARRQ